MCGKTHYYLAMVVVKMTTLVERGAVELVEAWRRRKWLNGKIKKGSHFRGESAEEKSYCRKQSEYRLRRERGVHNKEGE